VILEITAQAPGLSAEKWSAITRSRWRWESIRHRASSASAPVVLWTVVLERHVQIRCGLLLCLYANAEQHFAKRVAAGQSSAQIQQSSLVGRCTATSSQDQEFRHHQPAHGGGLVVLRRLYTVRAWCRSTASAARQGARSRGRPQQAAGIQRHASADVTALGNANVNVGGREIAIGQQSANIRGVGSSTMEHYDITKGRTSPISKTSCLDKAMARPCWSRMSRGYTWVMCADRHRRQRPR